MQQLTFLVEGRGETPLTAAEIKALHLAGKLTLQTRLSRDGKRWFAAVELLNRLPDEKPTPPPRPVLR